MVEVIATVSSKNQVTLPAAVRRRLGIHASDKISFVLEDDGTVTLRQARFTLDAILGSVRALPGESLDLDQEIHGATSEEIERTQARERNR